MYNYNNWNTNQQWSASANTNSGFGMQGQQMSQAMLQQQLGGQGMRPGVNNSQTQITNQLQMYQSQFQQQALLQQSNPNLLMYNQQAISSFAQQQYLQQQAGQQQNPYLQQSQLQQQPFQQQTQQQTQQQANFQQQSQQQANFQQQSQQQAFQQQPQQQANYQQHPQQQASLQQQFKTQSINQGISMSWPQSQQPNPPLPPPDPPTSRPTGLDSFKNNFVNGKPPLPPEPPSKNLPTGINDFQRNFENRPPPPPPPPEPKPVTSANLDLVKNPGIEDTVKKLLPFINDIFSKVGSSSHDGQGSIPGLGDLPVPKSNQEEIKQSQPIEKKSVDSWQTIKQNQNTASRKIPDGKDQKNESTEKNLVAGKPKETPQKEKDLSISPSKPTAESPKKLAVANSPSKLPSIDSPNQAKIETPKLNDKAEVEVEVINEVKAEEKAHKENSGKEGKKHLDCTERQHEKMNFGKDQSTPGKSDKESAPVHSPVNQRPTTVPNSENAAASQVYDLKTLQDFDKKFKDWEKQFDDWKTANRNHKDQGAYKRYVDQWSHWRNQLLDQRKFILDQIEKQKAAKKAEEAKKLQEAQEARELQEAERKRLEILTANAKFASNSTIPLMMSPKLVNEDRNLSMLNKQHEPMVPNLGRERMGKAENQGISTGANTPDVTKIGLLEPFSKFQQAQPPPPAGKNPFDIGISNPFDPNPFEVTANPFTMTNPGLRSTNVFDQQQFGKVGFTNFGGSSEALEPMFSNKATNSQQPTRISRVNLFDSGSQERPSKFPINNNANERDEQRWKGSSNSFTNRFGNQRCDSPPAKIPNRNEENIFDRPAKPPSNPFDMQSGSNSNSAWKANASNPWTTETQQQPTRTNPFEVSPLPTFAQFLQEQQQKTGQLETSENLQIQGRSNEKSFGHLDNSQSIQPETARGRSYENTNQDFERLFRRDRNLPAEPERISRRDPTKEIIQDGNFEEAVIDYGHGASNDVPDDDMLKYVRREEEPEFDENNYVDDDDDRLQDSVTIDYGHGSVNAFPEYPSFGVEEIPPHPRDYYDAPYPDNSFERNAHYGRREDSEMAFYRNQGPPPIRESDFYRGRPRREFEDMDGPRHPSDLGPIDSDLRLEGSMRGRGRGPRFAPPAHPGFPDLREEIRDSENSKDGRRRPINEAVGVKIAPPREDEDMRVRDGRERDRERERDRSKDKDRDRDKERDRDRRKDRDRDREDRERERERERERDRDKQNKFRGKDNSRDKDRENEWKFPRGHDGSPRRGDSDPNDFRRGRNANVRRSGRSRSRSPIIDNLVNPPPPVKIQPPANTRPPQQEPRMQTVLIEDILSVTGRKRRPSHIFIILRGLPGSGKSHVAKLIKDREIEVGGSAPRILSIDDYFMTEEVEKVVKDPVTGKEVKEKTMQYEYEPIAEASYRQDLIKTLKKTIENGYFPFIIVDSVNDQLKYFEEMARFATMKRFQVYIAEMEDNVEDCVKRNIHDRRREEILSLSRGWQKLPSSYVKLDIRTLLQDEAVQDVEMEDVCTIVSSVDEAQEKPAEPVVKSIAAQEADVVELEDDEEAAYEHTPSKWETIDHSEEKLNKLDGLRRKRKSSEEQVDQVSVESWLHRNLPDDYVERKGQNGHKRVRWADIEERREQERMRDIGFVVGHTDWNRMTDPTFGSSALTKTKFI